MYGDASTNLALELFFCTMATKRLARVKKYFFRVVKFVVQESLGWRFSAFLL